MANTHYIVLGGGLVGGFIARTLAALPESAVTLVDRDQQRLKGAAAEANLNIMGADLADPERITAAVQDADIVVGALPGFLGFDALKTVLTARKPCVDISFFPEDARELDELAKDAGVPAVVDCGVMPGLGGMLGMHLAAQFDTPEGLAVMVGGLPYDRVWPLEYRAPFSPLDVLEEYTRPARMRVAGQIVVRPPLSDVEQLEFPGLGTLEAFNTDGLRSLLFTMDLPHMVEKTLRYPGHAERIKLLMRLGFFDSEPRTVGGVQVAPRDLTAQLLFDAWQLKRGMREFTVMRVGVSGIRDGQRLEAGFDLMDTTDPKTGDFSMARTTGWPAILIARALASGQFAFLSERSGIMFPEQLATDAELFRYIIDGLGQAGVRLRQHPAPGGE